MTSEDSQPFHWHYAEFDDSNFEIHGRTLFFIIVLFAIIIFVILLFFYSRWVCRLGPPSPTTTTTTTTTRTTTSAREAPLSSQPQGLDLSTINSLPIVLHRTSTSSSAAASDDVIQVECCICLGVFQDGEKVKVLPDCHHCYHCECVDKWLTTHTSCPLCRASLRVDSSA